MSEISKLKDVQELLDFDFGVKISNRGGHGFKVFKGRNILKNQVIDFFADNRKEETCKVAEIFENYKVDEELTKKILKMDLLFILLLEGWNQYNLKDYMDKIDEYLNHQTKYYVENSLDKPELHSYKINNFTFNVGENFEMNFVDNKIKFSICNQEISEFGEEFTNLLANIVMDGKISPQSLIADMVIDSTNREMNIEIPAGQKVSSEKIYTGIDEFKSLMKDNFLF